MKKHLKLLYKINLFAKYVGAFGSVTGTKIFFKTIFGSQEISVQLDGLSPIYLRRASSDIPVFNQVFLAREYDWPITGSPKTIIDCGANIGLTTLFFKRKYPNATIVSLEPESSNFQQLEKNTVGYDGIKLVKAGVWSSNAFLKIEGTFDGNWGFICKEVDEPTDIPALGIRGIMDKFGMSEIDILKIDIEGSEVEVFSQNFESWLPFTKVIMIELHDFFRKGCSRAFFSALLKYDFSFDVRGKGKTLVCVRN